MTADWDVQVHSRDSSTWYTPESINAFHGGDCSSPPATHAVSSYADMVFQCKDHLMTAIKAGGYGVIYLTPDQMANLSAGVVDIKFDVSTARTSTRDFLSLWLTPYAENLALPLDDWLPDLQGVPKDAIHIRMDQFGSGSGFRVDLIRNYQTVSVNSGTGYYEEILTPSQTVRTTFELQVSQTHVKFGIPAQTSTNGQSMWWADTDVAPLGWSNAVLQLGHHSYNPDKACSDDGTCGANTWHWDNISISPSLPFSITKADKRYVDKNGASITFTRAAPPGGYLRFGAVGVVEVSFDGGATWSAAAKQPGSVEVAGNHHAEHASSYWTPIPAGATKATFRFSNDDWYQGPFIAQDFAIWSSTSVPGGSTTAVTPTATGVAANASIRGTVLLEGRSDASGVIVSATPGNATATTDASGAFVLNGLTAGQSYSIVARLPMYLPATRAGTVATTAGTAVPTTTLKAGDIDGNQQITIVDVSRVASDYGGVAAASDINKSGTVDITDVSLTAANYGLAGPTAW